MMTAQYVADRANIANALKASGGVSDVPHVVSSVLSSRDTRQAWNDLYTTLVTGIGYEFAGNTQQHLADTFGHSITSRAEDDVRAAVARYALRYVPRRVDSMLNATTRMIVQQFDSKRESKGVTYAHEELADEGLHTNSDVNAFLDDLYTKFGDDGSDALSQFETDTAGNAGQYIGADEMSGPPLEKVWMAVIDEHTREWHADMDGVATAMDEPFDVDGEDMMYPLDDSLGASGRNLYNCRCTTYYQESTDGGSQDGGGNDVTE